jgi:hypothetical protein
MTRIWSGVKRGSRVPICDLARDPATHLYPDNPGGVAFLLGRLREAGAAEQAAALVSRLPGLACSGCSSSSRTAVTGSGSAG